MAHDRKIGSVNMKLYISDMYKSKNINIGFMFYSFKGERVFASLNKVSAMVLGNCCSLVMANLMAVK
jgi:hypothetical protein